MKRKSLLFLLLFALIAPWAANAQETLTVYESETGTNNYIPIYGLWADANQQSEFIIPATELEDLANGTISQMTFHLSQQANKVWNGTAQVYLREVSETAFSTMSYYGLSGSELVYNGALDAYTSNEMVVPFNSTYTYDGGNLLVGFIWTTGGNYGSASFYGKTGATDASICHYGSNSPASQSFIPRTTFTYTPGAAPTCAKPTNLAVSYEGSIATATWEGEASLYNIEINGETQFGVTSPYPFAIEPNTTYTVKVQADCGGGDLSGWTTAPSFTTPCAAFALPYTYDFEDEGDLNCWTIIYTANTPGINTTYANSGTNSFRFSSYSSASSYDQYLISPEFNATTGMDVSFYYKPYSYGTEMFSVGYSTTTNETSAFTWVEDFVTTAGDDWTLVEETFPAGTKYVGIYYYSNYAYYLFVDDFTFDAPQTCPKPRDLVATNPTGHTVDLSWTETGSATTWQIMLDGDEDNLIPAPTNPFVLTGLDPETRYTVQVRAYCDATDQSRWSDEVTFITDVACPAPRVTVDNITPTTAEASWTGEASSYNLRYRPVESAPIATVILTAGDVWGDGSGYQMLLDADATAYGTIIPESGGLTSSGDASAATYAEFEYKIPVNADGSMTTTNVVLDNSIAIQIPAGTYDWCITNPTPGDRIWIASGNGSIPGRYDDYVFEAGNVYEFTVSFGGTNDQVDLTINGAKSAPKPAYAKAIVRRGEVKNIANVMPSIHNYTKLPLEVSSRDEEDWIVVEGVTSPYTLDVEPGTSYEVQVMAICGGEDGSSEWSASTYFTTPTMCDAPNGLNATNIMTTTATLNWNGYQDGFEVRYRPVNSYEPIFEENFENGIPSTWTTIDADGDGNNWFALSDIGTLYPFYASLDLSEWAHGGSNSAMSSSAYNDPGGESYTALDSDHWLITPQLTLGGTLKYYVRSANSSYADSYELLLSTTGNATTDFTITLKEMAEAPSTWTEVTIDLSEDYANQQGYIAIHHVSSDMYFLYIDDFGLYNNVEEEWETITTDAQFVDIEDLDPETEYEWQVRGEYRGCTNGENEDYTPWSTVSTFTTHSECDLPTALEATDVTATSATLNWTGYQDSFDVTYYTAATGTIIYEENNTFDGYADWTAIIDEENEESDFWYLTSDYSVMGYGFSSTDTPQYLISPEFDAIEGNGLIGFRYFATGTEENEDLPETFMIGYSTTDNEVSSFTWGDPVSVSGIHNFEAEIPEGAKYFAIQYTSDHTTLEDVFLFIIAPYVVSNYVPAGEPTTLDGVTSPVTITGLTPETIYYWEVVGINEDCGELEAVYSYFMTTYAQFINLAAGTTWFSTNLETTMADLQGALLKALPGAAARSIKIKSQRNGECTNMRNGVWTGNLKVLDVAQMYKITVPSDCEIMLSGWPVDPTEHPYTIVNGANWIGFPLQETMTVTNAFAGFPAKNDIVKAQAGGQAKWNNVIWTGALKNLEPGKGYIYNSVATEDKVFVYPTTTTTTKSSTAKPYMPKRDKVSLERTSFRKK